MTGLILAISKYWPFILLLAAVGYFCSSPGKSKPDAAKAYEDLIKAKDEQIEYLKEENKRLRDPLSLRREESFEWEV